MTMILGAKNKAHAQELLNAGCLIHNPTPFGTVMLESKECFIGFREPVVLDPLTRRRFATIERKATGWKVS